MNRLEKAAAFGAMMGKLAGDQQFIGSSNGRTSAPSTSSSKLPATTSFSGNAKGDELFQGRTQVPSSFTGFSKTNPYAGPKYSIHNPSPEQSKINATAANDKQLQKVNDVVSGVTGPYNNIPGLSDKQREMGNYKDFRKDYRQDTLNPVVTKGIKGQAIVEDQANDSNVMGAAVSVLPIVRGAGQLAHGGYSAAKGLATIIGETAYQASPLANAPHPIRPR
jgi:hypothetical protein